MTGVDGLIVGLLIATTVIAALCLVALIAVIENLKDVKAYHFTVIECLGTLDDRMREGHLKILKCLKGESYSGSFGGIDIHTSPNIPSGGLIFDPSAFPGDQQEQSHA